METVTIKMEKSLLKEIDSKLKENRYSTRTEFIRDALRHKLNQIDKEIIFKKLEKAKGSLKGKAKMSDKKAGELALKELAEELRVSLN